MSSQILDIRFVNRNKTAFELDVLTLQQLFQRRLSHSLEAPQRVHFNIAMLFTKGEGTHVIDFQKYACKKQTLLFVAENQVQQFQVNPELDAFLILFTRSFFYPRQEDQRILQNFRILDASLQSPSIDLSDFDYERFLFFFQEIAHEYRQQPATPFQPVILSNLLRIILMQAEQLKQTEFSPNALAAYLEFSRFKDQVEKDLDRTHNVKDYAHKLGTSTKLLNQWTQTVVNKPAKTFVDDRVILEIKRLLTHTNLPIKTIAEQTGFDEPTNLIKFFRQRTHQTPATFRNQSR